MDNKRLYRVDSKDTQLGGVSIGISEYLNIDVTLVRVLFVVLFFTPFPAFITYLILWGVLPIKYSQGDDVTDISYAETSGFDSFTTNSTLMKSKNTSGSLVGGAILIILGIIFSFKTFFQINLFHYIGQMWPLFLIGLGVWLVVREKPTDKDRFENNSIGGSTPNADITTEPKKEF